MAYPQTVANPFAAPATGAPPADNPFAAAPSTTISGQAAQAGNPFDPMAPPPQDPFAVAAPAQPASEPGASPPAANPFGSPTTAPAMAPQPSQNPPQQQVFPQQQQLVPQGQQPTTGYQPFGAQQATQAQGAPAANPFNNSTALVPTQQPANPYAGLVAPQQQVQPAPVAVGAQALVSATQPSSQWAVGGVGPAAFDPFARPPPPAPAPAPPPAPPVVIEQPAVPQQALPPPTDSQQLVVSPWGHQETPAPYEKPNAETSSLAPPPVNEVSAAVSSGQSVVSEPTSPVARAPAAAQEMVPYRPPSDEHPAGQIASSPQTKYGRILAQNAPPDAAPLPRAELVRKSGYILSRISFRTIIMKKWKQSFWVQYGPHTMIWFRSQADFNDWLNNPYHTQSQRNFLIKLAVNFVHDLYRPNVRGYQVTQSRTKAYGRNLMKQFKLERWMDYGPTIAAAFASRDPKEVDALREAIVECMRNTPQDSGIRATGAVRHDYNQNDLPNGEHRREYQYESERRGASYDDYEDATNDSYSASYESSGRHHSSGRERANSSPAAHVAPAPPPAPVGDLLDFSAPAPPPAPPVAAPAPPPPGAASYPQQAAAAAPPNYQYNAGVPPQPSPQQQMQPQYQY